MDFLLLIVEDDAFLRIDLADALAAGLGVVPQMRGSLAEAMAYDGRMPDLAILDIDLGDGKVFPFADRWRRRGCRSCSCPARAGRTCPTASRGRCTCPSPTTSRA